MTNKIIIYQLLPRLFSNTTENCVKDGTIEENGVGKLNDINSHVLESIKSLGVTHVWYTGVIEHATKTDYTKYGINKDNPNIVKGNAGSPYAIKDYYDIDPDLAVNIPKRMEEFEALVDRTHKNGMKVIIDFVPNHVARQYHSDSKPVGIEDLGQGDDNTYFFKNSNNFYYIPRQQFAPHIDLGTGDDKYNEFPAKATGNDCFSAFPGEYDWYETVKLNYGIDYGNGSRNFDPIPNTWFKMLHILRFWAAKGIDGFRCDMAHMVPIEFWEWAITNIKETYPNIIFIAEIYEPHLYRDFINKGGFDFLYDKVTLYDTLRNVQCANYSAAQITNCWQTVDGINHNMLNFLENHDEQRFAATQFAGDAAKVIPSLVVSSMINTGPMMIYAGQELGEQANDSEGYSGLDGRTTIFDYWSVPTLRRWYNQGKCNNELLTSREVWLKNIYAKILSLCNTEKTISHGAFFDLMYVNYENPTLNPHDQYVFLRNYQDETLIIAVNFRDNSCDLKINIPRHAFNFLNIPEGKYDAVELLTNEKSSRVLSSEEPFETFVSPFNAAIWKINHKKVKRNNKKITKQNNNNCKK